MNIGFITIIIIIIGIIIVGQILKTGFKAIAAIGISLLLFAIFFVWTPTETVNKLGLQNQISNEQLTQAEGMSNSAEETNIIKREEFRNVFDKMINWIKTSMGKVEDTVKPATVTPATVTVIQTPTIATVTITTDATILNKISNWFLELIGKTSTSTVTTP